MNYSTTNTNTQTAKTENNKFSTPTINYQVTTLPTNIDSSHYQEWLNSAISPEVILANLKSADGYNGFRHFLNHCEFKYNEYINTGKLRDRILAKYDHLYQGYWYINNYNPITKEEQLAQAKPNQPRYYYDKKDWTLTKKEIKYETPFGGGTPFIFLYIPFKIVKSIAQKHGIEELPDDNQTSIWEWVKNHSEIAIFITEGIKKAASLISHGFIAIASFSITTHSEKKSFEAESSWFTPLKPELLWLIDNLSKNCRRRIYITFDRGDKKLSSRIAVNQQSKLLAYKLHKRYCDVFIMDWDDEKCKGIDDYIVKHGQAGLNLIIKEALPFHKFKAKLSAFIHRKLTSDIKVNSRYCTDFLPLILESFNSLIENDTNQQNINNLNLLNNDNINDFNSDNINKFNENINFLNNNVKKLNNDNNNTLYPDTINSLEHNINLRTSNNNPNTLNSNNSTSLITNNLKSLISINSQSLITNNFQSLTNHNSQSSTNHNSPNLITNNSQSLTNYNSPNLKTENDNNKYIKHLKSLNKRKIKLVIIKSQQNTGKTELLQLIIDYFDKIKNNKTLNMTHRQSLATNLSYRLGLLCYLNSLKIEDIMNKKGLTISADSHHKLPPNFLFQLFTIDECEQFFWHLLDADTDIKYNRADKINHIFNELKAVILNNGFGIAVDADLSDKTVQIFMERLELKRDEILVIENTYQPFINRNLYLTNNVLELRNEINLAVENNERIMIHTGGQQVCSTHGTINLETALKSDYPPLADKIIRVDHESISDPTHEAFNIVNSPQKFKDYQVIIVSPTLNTGINLEPDLIGQIDKVFGIFYGNYPLDDFTQAIERYRGDCPRYIFIEKKTNHKIAYGETNHNQLVKHFDNQVKLSYLYADFSYEQQRFFFDLIRYYGGFASRINSDYLHLRDHFIYKAEEKGYQVIWLKENLNKEKKKLLKEKAKKTKNLSTKNYCDDIFEVTPATEEEYIELLQKRHKTKEERLKLKRAQIDRKYGDLNLEAALLKQLLFLDLTENIYSQLQLRFWLNLGFADTHKRDISKAVQYKNDHQDKMPYFLDVIKLPMSPKVKLLEMLGIGAFMEKQKIYSQEEIKQLKAQLKTGDKSTKKRVKNLLMTQAITNEQVQEFTDNWDYATDAFKLTFDIDLTNTENIENKGMTRFSMILNRLGYELEYVARWGGYERHRYYVIVDKCSPELYSNIARNWYEKELIGQQSFLISQVQ